MRLLLPVVTLLAACDAPCELDRLPDCPDCGPGEIRHGASAPFDELPSAPPVDVGATDASCIACDALHRFDAAGRPGATVGLDDPYLVATAPDGTIYTAAQYTPGEDALEHWRLRAYAKDGEPRWTVELGELSRPRRIVAGNEGAYVVIGGTGHDELSLYDAAAAGAKQWSERGEVVVPDGAGGALVFARDRVGVTDATTTITAFDAAHAQRWQRTLTSHDQSTSASVDVHAAHVTADGFVVAGEFTGSSLDLGGATVTTAPGLFIGFVASFDAQGQPRWGHAIDAVSLDYLSVTTAGSRVVVGARYVGQGGALGLPPAGNAPFAYNGLIAAFDARGPVAVHAFTGDDYQAVRSVVDGGDGSVWATLDTNGSFTLGDTVYAAGGAPRRYLINVVP